MLPNELLSEFVSSEAPSPSAFDDESALRCLDSLGLSIDDISEHFKCGLTTEYPSPEHSPHQTERTADTQPRQQEAAPKPKRKRENRYKNAPPSVLSRRRAQNRASQRAYRERKDQRIKDLETIINDLEQKNEVLTKAYEDLKLEYWKLKVQYDAEHEQSNISWDPSVPQLGDAMLYFGDPAMIMTNYPL